MLLRQKRENLGIPISASGGTRVKRKKIHTSSTARL